MAPISNATRLADFGSGIGTEGAVLKIDNSNKRVGIGSTVPASLLQVGLGITIDGTGMDVSGIITAKQFIGGGINTAASTNLTHLTVSGVTTFSGDVLVGASATVGFGSTVFFKDGNKLYFGNGEDFSIYHDGSHSYIDDTGTGGLFIDASVLTLRDDNDENYAVFTSDGSTDLYFNNSKKFETTNSGSIITGILTVTSDVSIGGTLTYEDVTNIDSVGVVTARDGVNVSGGQLIVGSGITMGSAGVATFSGTSDVHLTDNVVLSLGDSSDLKLWHNNSDGHVVNYTGGLNLQGNTVRMKTENGGETYLTAAQNGAVDIYYDNSKKFETTNDGTVTTGISTATGVDVTSNLTVGSGITMGSAGVATFSGTSDVHLLDNIRLNIGDSSDLTLYHDGSTSNIVNTSGTLNVGVNNFVLQRQGLDETMLTAVANGAVSLYYDDAVKFNTTKFGTITTGIATATEGDITSQLLVGSGITMGSAGVATFSGTGDVHLLDNVQLNVGDGSDLVIKHDGSNSYIQETGTGLLYVDSTQLIVRNSAGNEDVAKFVENAAVQLYYNNSQKFQTTKFGTITTGIATATEGDITSQLLVGSGITFGSAGVATFSGTSDVHLKDNVKLNVGDGSDLQVYHDGTHSYIKDAGTGYLRIEAADYLQLGYSGQAAGFLNCESTSGAVIINYAGNEKLQTTNDGTVTTGIATATSFTDDLGSLRTIPKNSQSGAYVLVAGDVGKTVYISTGGVTINQSVFSSGDLVTIINNSGSTQTITQGSSFTLYNTTDASTGNKTLNARGICTVWFADHNVGYISGNFA